MIDGIYVFPNRKYDEIVSVNDIPVTDSDLNLVKSLLDGAISEPNMVRQELDQFTYHVTVICIVKVKVILILFLSGK